MMVGVFVYIICSFWLGLSGVGKKEPVAQSVRRASASRK